MLVVQTDDGTSCMMVTDLRCRGPGLWVARGYMRAAVVWPVGCTDKFSEMTSEVVCGSAANIRLSEHLFDGQFCNQSVCSFNTYNICGRDCVT